MERRVIGVMTGTSLDGIDVAAVDVEGSGLDMQVTPIAHCGGALGDLAPRLRAVAERHPLPAGAFAELALDLGRLIAEPVAALVDTHGPVDLVAVHGQTIHHAPPVSWQLLNPAPIAAAAGCSVVFDLRQADLAAGGQGAPITPLADWLLFRDDRRRAIVNLGGFCNVTVLPSRDDPEEIDAIRGYDVCACNQVLDAAARAGLGSAFDIDGAAAATGRIDANAHAMLATTLGQQRASRRSLGTGDEAAAWVTTHTERLTAPDLCATAVAAVAGVIGAALRDARVDEVVLAGGGARNRTLVDTLARSCDGPVAGSDALGVPVDAREAIAIAVLGALCVDEVPITLPQVTGCRAPAPVAGVIALRTS